MIEGRVEGKRERSTHRASRPLHHARRITLQTKKRRKWIRRFFSHSAPSGVLWTCYG
jgi:hypothetical protein